MACRCCAESVTPPRLWPRLVMLSGLVLMDRLREALPCSEREQIVDDILEMLRKMFHFYPPPSGSPPPRLDCLFINAANSSALAEYIMAALRKEYRERRHKPPPDLTIVCWESEADTALRCR